jgi:hypothetical protein
MERVRRGEVGEYLDSVQPVEAIVSDPVSVFAGRTALLAKDGPRRS